MYSNKKLARLAGLLYLVVIATGLFAEVFVREALNVPGNALATARHIQSSEMLYRWGFVADLINLISGLPVILVFYILFTPVHKSLTLLAMFFVIVSNAIIALNLLNQLAPLFLLGNEHYLGAFNQNQLAALSKNALNMQEQGYAIALVFFGCYCIIIGWLIFRCSFLPRILGILYALAGIAYLVNSFTGFLSHGFANPLFPYILVPAFIGELSVALWLLVMGVKDRERRGVTAK